MDTGAFWLAAAQAFTFVSMVVWVLQAASIFKLLWHLKRANQPAARAFWSCQFARSSSAVLFLTWSFVIENQTWGMTWYQSHCKLVMFIMGYTIFSFVLWSLASMRVLLRVVANPFRAYGGFELRHCVFFALIFALEFGLYGLHPESLCVVDKDTCLEYSTQAGNLFCVLLFVFWLHLSVCTYRLANTLRDSGMHCNSLVRKQSAVIWRRFSSFQVVESFTFLVLTIIRTIYPCIVPHSWAYDDPLTSIGIGIDIAFSIVMLAGGFVVSSVPDPQSPSHTLGTNLFRCVEQGVHDTLDAALRRESLECITRGIVASIHQDRDSIQLDSLSAQLLPLSSQEPGQLECNNKRSWQGVTTTAFLSSSHFEFVDFAGEQFWGIRELFGVNSGEYADAVQQTYLRNGLQMQLSNSRSGSFFYFTHNHRFLVKSLQESEVRLLQEILPSYTEHVRKFPHTLLPQFFGCHAIRYGTGGELVYFVVMANVNHRICELQEQHHTRRSYDIKGSTVGRSVGSGSGTLKDLDQKIAVKLALQHYNRLTAQLNVDSTWLRTWDIMDYSLLLTVLDHKDGVQCQVSHPCCGGASFSTSLCCVGLIDVLQRFDVYKRAELAVKSVVYCHERRGLSCVAPAKYQQRFMKHVCERVFEVD